MEPRPVMATTPPSALHERPSDLEQGDAFALDGRWADAVGSWELSLASENRNRARARLTWLADEATVEAPTHHWWAGSVPIGVAAALAGTGLVLVAERQSQALGNALTVAAWVLYSIAAACGLVYAYQHRPRGERLPDAVLVARARDAAMVIENGSGTIGADSLPTD